MDDPPSAAPMSVSEAVTETGHGRIETRRAWVSTDIDGIQERHA